MSDEKLKEAPLVRSALQIDVDQDIPSLEELASQKSIWSKLGPYIAGFVSFLLGLILFMPLDDFALESIGQIDLGKGAAHADKVLISILGSLDIRNFSLNLPSIDGSKAATGKSNHLKSNIIEGDISLLGFLLFDTLSAKVSIKGLILDLTSSLLLSLKGEELQIIFDGSNLKSGIASAEGKLQMNGINLIGNYDQVIPGVGEKLGAFIISNLIGEMNLKSGVLKIKDFRIESNISEIKASGSIGISNSSRTSLRIEIDPSALIRKYAENNIEPLLKNLGYLHDDGKMFYECQGGLSNCKFKQSNNS